MNVQKKAKGFTIIEVVLVLAIAGLIFLIIFLALPALQRNQRDTQRRSDLGRVIAATQSYQSNNNGGTPYTFNTSGVATSMGTLETAYMDGNFKVPSSNPPTTYALSTSTTVSEAAPLSIFKAVGTTNGSNCDTAVAATGGTRLVFKMWLESGGSTCQTN